MDETAEIWREVEDAPGYQVSSLGRVRGRQGRILKAPPAFNGYPLVRLSLGSRFKVTARYVHHLVLTAFHGPCPSGYEAAHQNGVRFDNRAENLRWMTHTENMRQKREHGTAVIPYWRRARGTQMPDAVLNESLVVKIREMRKAGARLCDIARQFGLGKTCVRFAAIGKTWTHVPFALLLMVAMSRSAYPFQSTYINILSAGGSCSTAPVVQPGAPYKDCSIAIPIPNGAKIAKWKLTGRFYTHHSDGEMQIWFWNGGAQAVDGLSLWETKDGEWVEAPLGDYFIAKDPMLKMRLFNEGARGDVSGTSHIRLMWE